MTEYAAPTSTEGKPGTLPGWRGSLIRGRRERGAMPNEKQNDPRIPRWFSLDKYERASNSSFVEWALNLKLRNQVLGVHAGLPDRPEYYEKDWALLTEIGFLSMDKLSGEYDEAKEDILKSMELDDGHGFGLVYGLPLRRAYEIYEEIDSDTKLRQILDKIESQGILHHKRLEPLSSEERDLSDWYYSEFTNQSFDSCYGDNDGFNPAVCVDMLAPDEMIVDAFRKWLTAARKRNDEIYQFGGPNIAPKKFSERWIARWQKASILPYLDLKIFEQISGVKIPLHVVGNAIFPNTAEFDTTESVRKTTKPLAEAALQQHHYLLRQAIIDELQMN